MAGLEGRRQPRYDADGDEPVRPMLLVDEVKLQVIAGVPGASRYLWDLQSKALEHRLRSKYVGSPAPRDVVCSLPLFTELESDEMAERLHLFFGESGPFRQAGVQVNHLLFASRFCATVREIRDFNREIHGTNRESVQVNRLLFGHPELLALYSSGRVTGMVLNLGHTITILPIFDGYMIECAARRHAWPPAGPAGAIEHLYIDILY
eukprot:SAG31_NODE_5342_length_2597_cov_1.625300_3_plen_207_part_00